MYYEDERTGSIYSGRKLIEMARRERITLGELERNFRQLPCSTVLLLEEAEIVAARAGEDQGRRWFGRSEAL